MKELSAYLIAAREQAGLSVREASRRSGYSPTYISQLEHGTIKQPSPRVLAGLSQCYESDYAKLMQLAGYAPMLEQTQADTITLPGLDRLTADDREDVMALIHVKLKRQRSV